MDYRLIAFPGLEVASLDDQSLVLQPETGRFHLMNVTAAFILSRLREACTPTEIANDLVAHFEGVDCATASTGLSAVLKQMLDEGIVTVVEENASTAP